MSELFAGGDNAISLPISSEWLFHGLLHQGTPLEAQTSILNPGPATGRISRWALDSFPLKVFVRIQGFDPLSQNLLEAQLFQTLSDITAVNPELFTFAEAPTPESADVVFQLGHVCEGEALGTSAGHPLDSVRIGPEGQLRRVELVIPIYQAGAPAAPIIVASALKALGVSLPQEPLPSAVTVHQTGSLTAMDKDTLQLLYRCPIALSHRELSLLWRAYQSSQRAQQQQADFLEALLNSPPDREAKVLARTLLRRRSSELSMRELALQESIQSVLGQIESA